MNCKKKGCGGFISLQWNADMITDGLFVIEGECEMCHAEYAVAMQLFEKSKMKKGTRVDHFIQSVPRCPDCSAFEGLIAPGEKYQCDLTGKRIQNIKKIPKWCPLPRLI